MARGEGKWTVIGSVAGVAAALIALVALVVQVDTGQSPSGRSQTQQTGVGAATTATTTATTATRPAGPSPTSSSASAMTDSDKEFAAAKTGACFDAVYDLLDGNTGSDGSDGGPEIVPCTSGQAYYKVTKAYRPESEGSCAGTTDDGIGEWSNSGPGSSSVTLCIQRFFQPDQCFLGEGSGQSVTVDVLKGRDCSRLLNLDRPYNLLMEIIAVKPGSDTISDCPSQYPGQVVYSTRALNDTVLLCLKIAIQGSK